MALALVGFGASFALVLLGGTSPPAAVQFATPQHLAASARAVRLEEPAVFPRSSLLVADALDDLAAEQLVERLPRSSTGQTRPCTSGCQHPRARTTHLSSHALRLRDVRRRRTLSSLRRYLTTSAQRIRACRPHEPNDAHRPVDDAAHTPCARIRRLVCVLVWYRPGLDREQCTVCT